MELTSTKYKQTEVGLIPEEWEVRSLGEVAKINMGQSPLSSNYNNQGIGLPLIQGNADVKKRKTIIRNFTSQITKTANANDIIMSVRAPVGEISRTEFDCCIGRGVCSIKYDNNFLYHYLIFFENSWSQFSTGSTFDSVNSNQVKSIPIPLPPTLTEQKAIATALSDVDSLISSLDKLITKKKAIKQGAMQELLTPPHKGGRRLPGFSGDWEERTIDDLSKTFTKQTGFDYSSHIKPTLIDKKQRGYIPFIQNKDFDGHKVNFDTDYYIPEDVAFRFPRILLNERCLMISISGSIGKVGVFNNVQVAFIGGAVAVGKFHNPQLLDWVMYYLHSNAGQNLMLKDVKAGSHQNLILDDIRKMNIPIPDLNEQKAITKILSDMDLEIESLENKKAKYQEIKQGMMQELLTGKTRLI